MKRETEASSDAERFHNATCAMPTSNGVPCALPAGAESAEIRTGMSRLLQHEASVRFLGACPPRSGLAFPSGCCAASFQPRRLSGPLNLPAEGNWPVLRLVLKLGGSGHAVLCNTCRPYVLINRYARDGGPCTAPDDDESCSMTNADVEGNESRSGFFVVLPEDLDTFPLSG